MLEFPDFGILPVPCLRKKCLSDQFSWIIPHPVLVFPFVVTLVLIKDNPAWWRDYAFAVGIGYFIRP